MVSGGWLRGGALSLLLFASLAALPLSADAEPSPAVSTESGLPVFAEDLLRLGADYSADNAGRAMADFLQRADGPSLYRTVVPPESIYRGVDPVCDLDGDGVADLITNDMQLGRAGRYDSGGSFIRAISGGDGEDLWTADNENYATLTLAHGYSSARPGQPNPAKAPNVAPVVDINGDGVCDLFSYGFDQTTIVQEPLFGSPSLSTYDITVRVLSGKDGSPIWEQLIQAYNLDASEPLFGTESTRVILGFPTGFQLFQGPQGPRFIVKTTDLVYVSAEDFLGLTAPVASGSGLFAVAMFTGEHIIMADATTGATIWQKDFGFNPLNPGSLATTNLRQQQTNITWISGVGDLTGDGEPDIVLDQFTITNPRTSPLSDPQTGEPLFRYGRGMRMMAVDGAGGDLLWSQVLLDPLAVQTPPPNEDNLEILAWTYGTVLDDVTGDGRAEPVAQYLAEEQVGGTPNGRFRTHFIPLDGATGGVVWEHAQQGWGYAADLGGGLLAVGTIDLPDPATAAVSRSQDKAQRITGIEVATGAPAWTYEAPFAQDSQSSYEIGLQHMRHNLAPMDIDGDGILDVVTPSQYVEPVGRNQVFLATAQQDFDVLSGADGERLQKITTWGSSGLFIPCSGSDDFTFAVGHARRLDLVRLDSATGEEIFRQPIWNYDEPRSSVVGIDLISMDGVCVDDGGRTTYGVNLEAYSFFRQYEILPLIGVLNATGKPTWLTPEMENEPPTPSLLETYARHKPLIADGKPLAAWTVVAIAAGLLLGWLVGIPMGRALARRRRRLDPLGIALLLMFVPAGVMPDAAPFDVEFGEMDSAVDFSQFAPGLGDHGNQASEAGSAASASQAAGTDGWLLPGMLGRLGPDWQNADSADWTNIWRAMMAPDVSERYDENHTITFPHVLGDEDGDGVDDIALDVYCTDYASCRDPFYPITQPTQWVAQNLRPNVCGPYHRLVVISGGTGDRLWDQPLDTPHPLSAALISSCAAEVVVGTVPFPEGGSGILIMRFESIDAAIGLTGRVFNHTLMLRDGATGAVRWSFSEPGYVTPELINVFGAPLIARSILLNPVLTTPEADKVPDRTAGAGQSLFVRGIGFTLEHGSTFFGLPTLDDAERATDIYLPNEWLARLDPLTGQVLWRVESFLPEEGRSVLPMSPNEPLFRDDFYGYETYSVWPGYEMPYAVPRVAWQDQECCGDLTGDGVWDPVFRTLEWNLIPNLNTGPHRFDGRLVAFDGSTGAKLYEPILYEELPGESQRRPYYQYPYDSIAVELNIVGDADGDGAADILAQKELRESDYGMEVRLISGRTGDELWSLEFPRAQKVLSLGDADGDGGSDLLFVDWFRLERLAVIPGDYTNVTATPIRLRSGADGHVLYETKTINAPLDMVVQFETQERNGLADLDGDGVGDYAVDDPIYLPDQVTLHQLTYVSGRDASPIFSIPVAGAFAFPARLPDLTGDGVDEIAVLSGDPNDLWMSYRDGSDGSAMWGHRAFAIRISSYALALPKMEFLPLVTGHGADDRGVLANLHMDVEQITGEYNYVYIEIGGSSGGGRVLEIDSKTIPQLTAILDADGMRTWSYPSGGEVSQSRLDGETPGTALVLSIRSEVEPTPAYATARFLEDTTVPLIGLGVAFVAALLVTAMILRRREVPA